jgi:hypothetical protein
MRATLRLSVDSSIARNFASSAGRVSSRFAIAFNTLNWLTFNPTSARASSYTPVITRLNSRAVNPRHSGPTRLAASPLIVIVYANINRLPPYAQAFAPPSAFLLPFNASASQDFSSTPTMSRSLYDLFVMRLIVFKESVDGALAAAHSVDGINGQFRCYCARLSVRAGAEQDKVA